MIKIIKEYLKQRKAAKKQRKADKFDHHLYETMAEAGPGTADMIVNAMKWGIDNPSPHFIRRSLVRLEEAGKIHKGELEFWHVVE